MANEQAENKSETTQPDGQKSQAIGTNSQVLDKLDQLVPVEQTDQSENESNAVQDETSLEVKDEKTESPSIDDPLAEFEDPAEVKEDVDNETLDELDDEKNPVQKRIDKLTAKNKALEEKLAQLEGKFEKPAKEEVEYDSQTLKSALKKALETQDVDLMMDIMDYRVTSERKKAEKEYQKRESEQTEQIQRLNREWVDTLKRYGDLWDMKKDEIYPGSKKELDLRRKDSALYQLALRRMQREPQRYNVVGGQTLAVSDALAQILRKRVGSSKSPQQQMLERKLQNEKVKNQLTSGSSGIPDEAASKNVQPKTETLEDYVAKRKLTLSSKKGGIKIDA